MATQRILGELIKQGQERGEIKTQIAAGRKKVFPAGRLILKASQRSV